MTAGGRYSRKTMPGGIFWDAGDSPRGAFGACQDARGRWNGHVYDSVVGSEQSLELWDIYTRSAGILTGISSLFEFMTIFFVCTKFLYRICNFMGIAQDKSSKTITPFFYSCVIIGSPGLSVIPPPPLDHCAAVLPFCPMEGINLVFKKS